MKIQNANFWTIKSKVEQKSRNRYGAVDFLERTLLRLEDEKGNEGWGEMMPIIFTTEKADNATKAMQTVTESLKKMSEIEPISNSNVIDNLHDLSELKAARSSIECALLDIESKREQKSFLEILLKQNVDFTSAFRDLSNTKDSFKEGDYIISLSKNKTSIVNWLGAWKKRISKERRSIENIKKDMKKVNPVYVPRNHILEKIIKEAVENEKFSLMNDLLDIIKNPFIEKKNKKYFSLPPSSNEIVRNTFCGT